MLIARTASRFQRAVLAVLSAGFIAVEDVARLVRVSSFVAQMLVSRTYVEVWLGIVDEDRSGEAARAGVIFLRAPFAQTADIVHPKLGHGFDTATVGVISIGQHLLWLVAQASRDASNRGRELFAVIGGLGYFHVHDQRLRGQGVIIHHYAS